MNADYDAWLIKGYEAEQARAERAEGLAEPIAIELINGQSDICDYATEEQINTLFKTLTGIAWRLCAPSIRLDEMQRALTQFADDLGMRYARENADAQEAHDWHTRDELES